MPVGGGGQVAHRGGRRRGGTRGRRGRGLGHDLGGRRRGRRGRRGRPGPARNDVTLSNHNSFLATIFFCVWFSLRTLTTTIGIRC